MSTCQIRSKLLRHADAHGRLNQRLARLSLPTVARGCLVRLPAVAQPHFAGEIAVEIIRENIERERGGEREREIYIYIYIHTQYLQKKIK